MRKRLTARQMADGYVVVVIRLSDLCAHTSRYSQVKNAIVDMAKRKPIAIPYKCDVNQVTYYAEFPRLFSCEFIRMGGHLAVEFRFSNDLLDYSYSFDKGVAHVNLDVVNHCCSASSIKLYIITLCWSLKGYTKIDPKKFIALMHGRKNYYKYFSDLMSKSLQPVDRPPEATLRLWHGGSVSHAIYRLFRGGCPRAGAALRGVAYLPGLYGPLPWRNEVQEDKIPEELRFNVIQLKIKLMNRYDVSEATAKELSSHLFLGMLGDFVVWFERKEKYVAERIRLHQPMKKAAYIVSALRGLFKDRGSLPVKSSGASSPDPVPEPSLFLLFRLTSKMTSLCKMPITITI